MNTHLPIIIAAYLFFALIAMVLELYNALRHNQITIIFMCRILYVVGLAVLPALIYWGHLVKPQSTIVLYEDNLVWTFYVQYILTVFGYVIMNFGYRLKQRQIVPKRQVPGYKIISTATIFLMISGISLLLWASAYGGISFLLEDAEWIRAGVVKSGNGFTFFKHFVPLSMMASYMLFYSFLTKTVTGTIKKLYAIALLVVSVGLSLIYLQANDGRLLLMMYFLLFFLMYFRFQSGQKQVALKSLLLKAVPILIVGILILFKAEDILNWLRGTGENNSDKGSQDFFSVITKEFMFIPGGAQRAIIEAVTGKGKLLIVNDVVNGLFAWLPTSMKPIQLMDVWAYNTELVSPGVMGANPTSIVAQSVYDLGFVGIIVIPLLFGMLIKKVEKILDSYGDDVFAHTVYAILGYSLCKGVAYFSLYNILLNMFYIFLGIILYSILKRLKLKM